MVSESEAIEMILAKFSKFRVILENEVKENWDGEKLGLYMEMTEFSRYIRDLISRKNSKDEEAIKLAFILIERLMVEGTEEVQTAAATCFLENLINAVSWERISSESFVHLLGKESKAYCRAWDEFTGVKTDGLWIDEKI